MAMDLTNCQLCPRRCGVNRAQGELGRCKAGPVARLARAALHFWEEPCISGSKGSGTVFFPIAVLVASSVKTALSAVAKSEQKHPRPNWPQFSSTFRTRGRIT